MTIKVGDKLRNNDPRTGSQVVTITAIRGDSYTLSTYAVYKGKSRYNKVRFDHIYPASKITCRGWTHLPAEAHDVIA